MTQSDNKWTVKRYRQFWFGR